MMRNSSNSMSPAFQTALAEKHLVPLSTFCNIIKDKQKIIGAYNKMHSAKRTKVRPPTYTDVEDALVAWLQKGNAAHLPANGTILGEKPNQLVLQLGHEEFNGAMGGSVA